MINTQTSPTLWSPLGPPIVQSHKEATVQETLLMSTRYWSASLPGHRAPRRRTEMRSRRKQNTASIWAQMDNLGTHSENVY